MAVWKLSEKPTETAATSSQEPGKEMLSTALVFWAVLVKMMLFWDGRSAALFGACMKARAAEQVELDWEMEQASYSSSSEWTDLSDLPEPTTLPTALGPEAVVINSSPDQSPQLLPQAPPRPTTAPLTATTAPPPAAQNVPSGVRQQRCSICRQLGHKRTTCQFRPGAFFSTLTPPAQMTTGGS